MGRDWGSPRYARWRKAVYARDGSRCRLCGGADGLNAHHIKMWARYPSLRFAVSNGITLCRVCHLRVTGREEEFAAALGRVVRPSDDRVRLGMLFMRYGEEAE